MLPYLFDDVEFGLAPNKIAPCSLRRTPALLQVDIIERAIPNYYHNGNLGNYNNILLATVWVNSKTKTGFNSLNLSVKSNKHGKMISTPRTRNSSRDSNYNKELMYAVPISLSSSNQIIEEIKNDFITITVDGYTYKMLNPEVSFND